MLNKLILRIKSGKGMQRVFGSPKGTYEGLIYMKSSSCMKYVNYERVTGH
jgi:hypothetical protein